MTRPAIRVLLALVLVMIAVYALWPSPVAIEVAIIEPAPAPKATASAPPVTAAPPPAPPPSAPLPEVGPRARKTLSLDGVRYHYAERRYAPNVPVIVAARPTPGPSGGYASPEEAVRALYCAMAVGDVDAALATFDAGSAAWATRLRAKKAELAAAWRTELRTETVFTKRYDFDRFAIVHVHSPGTTEAPYTAARDASGAWRLTQALSAHPLYRHELASAESP